MFSIAKLIQCVRLTVKDSTLLFTAKFEHFSHHTNIISIDEAFNKMRIFENVNRDQSYFLFQCHCEEKVHSFTLFKHDQAWFKILFLVHSIGRETPSGIARFIPATIFSYYHFDL